MELCVAKIMDCPGASLPFAAELDLSDMDFGGCCPVDLPLRVAGQIKNTAGVLLLTGSMHTTLHGQCDRCCSPYTRDYSGALRAVITPALSSSDSEDESIFELSGDMLDLDDVVTTQFVFSMDSKLLCSEDCLGLCPRCGANLNDGPCGCKKELDPRLAALAQLLEDRNET